MAAAVKAVHQSIGCLIPGRIMHAPDIRPIILLMLGDGIAEDSEAGGILLVGICILHGDIGSPEALIGQGPQNNTGM